MFEKCREQCLTKEQEDNYEKIKTEIFTILKYNNLSLSQVRLLFTMLVDDLEDAPLK